MIRLLTLLTFFCFTTLSYSQVTIEASQNPSYNSGKAADYDVAFKISITNTNSTTSSFTWTRNESELIDGWESSICVDELCYINSVGTSSFELAANTTNSFEFHIYPKSLCGSGYGEINITDDNDPNNTITLRFDADIETDDGSECLTPTGTVDFKLDYVDIYPNPANDFFTLTDIPSDLELIQIYNIFGSKVRSFTASQNANYDISDLSRGMYLIKLTNSKGENLNTTKVYKN